MIDVLHLYVGAGVARPESRRTTETALASPPSSRRGRLRSTNPVVSHLPIEIRCNLYWLCITEHRIAFVRPHYVVSSAATAISRRPLQWTDRPADVFRRRTMRPFTIFKTATAANGVTIPTKENERSSTDIMNDRHYRWPVTHDCSVMNEIIHKSLDSKIATF